MTRLLPTGSVDSTLPWGAPNWSLSAQRRVHALREALRVQAVMPQDFVRFARLRDRLEPEAVNARRTLEPEARERGGDELTLAATHNSDLSSVKTWVARATAGPRTLPVTAAATTIAKWRKLRRATNRSPRDARTSSFLPKIRQKPSSPLPGLGPVPCWPAARPTSSTLHATSTRQRSRPLLAAVQPLRGKVAREARAARP